MPAFLRSTWRLTGIFVLGSVVASCSNDGGSSKGGRPAPSHAEQSLTAPATAAHTGATVSGAIDLATAVRRTHGQFRPAQAAHMAVFGALRAEVDALGARVTPLRSSGGSGFGPGQQGAPLTVRTSSIERNGNRVDANPGEARVVEPGDQIAVARGAVREEFKALDEGLQQDWVFGSAPEGAGDLVVRVQVDGEEYAGETGLGLHFVDRSTDLGLRYGLATWIDASGRRTQIRPSWEAGTIVIRVPARVVDGSSWPAVLDPVISAEIDLDNLASLAAQTQLAAAFDGTNYLVVWSDTSSTVSDIYGVRVSKAGAVLDATPLQLTSLAGAQDQPAVAFDGTRYMVVFHDAGAGGGDIGGVNVSTAGVAGAAFNICVDASPQLEPAIAWDSADGSHLVVWTDQRNVALGADVYGLRIGGTGTPVGIEIAVATVADNQSSPAVAFNGTNHFVVWTDRRSGADDDVWGIRVAGASGALVGSEIKIGGGAGDQRTPAVAWGAGNFFVAWASNGAGAFDVQGARVDAAGAVVDSPVLGLSAASNDQLLPAVTNDGAQFLAVWQDERNSMVPGVFDIYGTRVTYQGKVLDPAGVAIAGDPGTEYGPTVAADGARLSIVGYAKGSGPSQASARTVHFGLPPGAVCALPADCESGFCADGVCCDSACGNSDPADCQACNQVGFAGQCKVLASTVTCRVSAGECDVAETCDGSLATCPADGHKVDGTGCTDDGLVCTTDVCSAGACTHPAGNAGTLCRASTGECDPAEACNGTLTTCPTDAFVPNGTACTDDGQICTTDLCSGGACAHAAGNAGVTCRGAAGECDVAESCNGSLPTCPGDVFKVNGTACTDDGLVCTLDQCSAGVCAHPAGNAGITCRTANGECDVAEACNGTSTTCPTDGFKGNGTPCTDDGLLCTVDQCSAGACVHPAGNVGTICRAAQGECDVAEACDGASTTCPANGFKADGTTCTTDGNPCTLDQCGSGVCAHPAGNAGTVCRPVNGECDVAESCTGSSTSCPADGFKTDGTACTTDGNPCTLDECASGACAHPPGNAGTECRAAGGICDVAENCTGTSATCPNDLKKPPSTVCRAAAGPCDLAENCNGLTNGCPTDVFRASSFQCRAPSCTGGVGTLAANCPGNGPSCPATVTQNCPPYICQGNACGGSCTSINDCVSGNYCDAAQCKPKKINGGTCSYADMCQSGQCVDGVCCNVACAGQCQACDVTGSVGTCVPVTGKPHGSRPLCLTDGTACGGACNGVLLTACSYPGNTQQCRAPSCNNNVAILAASCAGNGFCPAFQTQACAPFTCSGTQCGGNCTIDTDCSSGSYCSAGICKPKVDAGQPCSAPNQCKSNYCVDSYCCNGPCVGQCEACDVQGKVGACSPVNGTPHGARPACATDGTACGGTCNGILSATCSYSTSQCRAPQCANEVATLAASCDGLGACPPVQLQTCTPFSCNGTQCGAGCVIDTDCAGGSYCSAGVCHAKLNVGFACGGDNQCNSGYCVDAVCCGGACVGQCEACDLTGQEGTCLPAIGAPHGARPACSSDGSVCAGTCDGVGTLGCSYPDSTLQCRPPNCDNNIATLAASCTGTGSCPAVQTQPCAPFLCLGGQCAGDCTLDTDCDTGSFCAGGICKVQLEVGQPCGGNNQCKSTFCADGYCCATACAGQCEACDVPNSLGACSPVVGAPHGGKAACAGAGVCQGQCDGVSVAACAFPGTSVECSAATCANGVEKASANCDGAGTCTTPSTKSCGDYVCNGATCMTSCTKSTDCAAGHECIGKVCVQPEAGPDVDAAGDAKQDGPDGDAKSEAVLDAIADVAPDQGQGGSSSEQPASGDDGGCGCRTAGRETRGEGLLALLALGVLISRRRRGGVR
ncbi:MAG: hypothetical protein HY898_11710 [Deltaproteobacteria bacterium]|nr:hypothetical protein [Deltaproteobacteria bacterium]